MPSLKLRLVVINYIDDVCTGDAGKFDQEWKDKTRGFHAGRNGIGGEKL